MTIHRWTLPGDDTAPGIARAHLARVLSDVPTVDDAIQIASELVANAVGHGAPPFDLHVELAGRRIRLTVSNGDGSAEPTPRSATLDDVRGRGLAIVAALSDDWGWHHADGQLHVWAELHQE